MKLRYQTASFTLAQFIIMMVLAVPNTLVSVISTCTKSSSDCVSNGLVSLMLFILTALWFGMILIFGYFAQKQRDRKYAIILMGLEFINLVTAGYINFPRDPNILAKFTSLTDSIISIIVIYLAFNILRAGNTRLVSSRVRKSTKKKK